MNTDHPHRDNPMTKYKVRHADWRDDLLFFPNGSYRRASTSCRGEWTLDQGALVLKWKQWGKEVVLWNGRCFSNKKMVLEQCDGCDSLWQHTDQTPPAIPISPINSSEQDHIDITQNAWVMTTPDDTGIFRVSKFHHQFVLAGVPLPREYTCFNSRQLFKTFHLDIRVEMYKKTVLGLMLSRYGMISMAKSLRLPYIVTYENDVVLCEDFFNRARQFISALSQHGVAYDSLRLGWTRPSSSCRKNWPPPIEITDQSTGETISYYDFSAEPCHLPGNFVNVIKASAYDKILETFYIREHILSTELARKGICAPGGSDNWLANPCNGITLSTTTSLAGHSGFSTL